MREQRRLEGVNFFNAASAISDHEPDMLPSNYQSTSCSAKHGDETSGADACKPRSGMCLYQRTQEDEHTILELSYLHQEAEDAIIYAKPEPRQLHDVLDDCGAIESLLTTTCLYYRKNDLIACPSILNSGPIKHESSDSLSIEPLLLICGTSLDWGRNERHLISRCSTHSPTSTLHFCIETVHHLLSGVTSHLYPGRQASGPCATSITSAAAAESGWGHGSALAQSISHDEGASASSQPNTTLSTARGSWLARVSQRASHISKVADTRPRDTLPLRSAAPARSAGSSDRLITTVLKTVSPLPVTDFLHSPTSPASTAGTEFGVTPIEASFGDRVVTPPRDAPQIKPVQDMERYNDQTGDSSYDSDADADDEFERSMVGSPELTKDDQEPESDHPSESEEEHGSADGEDTPTTQAWTAAKSPVTSWSASEVAEFVSSLAPQMKSYRDSFIEEEINGEALVSLQHDELQELGISSVGHRLTILKAIYGQKKKSGVKIMEGDYVPLSAEDETEVATQEDIARLIKTINVRDQRIIAAEEQLRELRADLERMMDDNRKLREETLPAVRLMKNQHTPLPDPNAGTLPSPREIEIIRGDPGSAGIPKDKSISRKLSTKKFALGGPSKLSPTHPAHSSVRDDGAPHLEASAAAMAASNHLTASMASQASPNATGSQPLSPGSPAYTQQSTGSSYHGAKSTLRTGSRSQHDDTGTGTTSWGSNSTLVDSQVAAAVARQDRSRRQAPTPSPREDDTPGGSRESKDHGVEVFKSFRVSVEDPCEVVLPVALKRYQIHDDWRQYSLYIVHGDQERCLGLKEKPLMLFKQLDKEGRKPMFMLRRHATPQTGWTGSVGGGAGDRNIPGGVL